MNDKDTAITREAAAISEQIVALDSVMHLLMILEGHADTTVPVAGALRLARNALDGAVGRIEHSAAAIEAAAQDVA